jgi:myo-inositol-1(or 4)-monophosphatase
MRAYLEAALEAAYLAQSIHSYYRERLLETSAKSGPTDLVTQVDREAEEAIRELLQRRFPDHAFWGEEGGQRGDAEAIWIVDPLDGTVNYAHRFPFYAVSIALALHGELTLGVVLDTAHQELFVAQRGQGATLNGRPLHVSSTSRLIESLLATGFPYNVGQETRSLTLFERALRRGLTVRRPGAAALDLAYVAAGRIEAFWELHLNPWDVAAGWLLVEEAGGRVSDLQGEPYRLSSPEVVASNGLVHQELLEVLSG